MGQKIKLSSNIPITLPQNLSAAQFGLGFLYPCNTGQGLQIKAGETWFEKVCLSLNKINSIVGFQSSDLKIPEYIAQTIDYVEKQLETTSLVVRYNAQTKINDLISSLAPKETRFSFDDQLAKSLTKGTPMVIIGEKKLKNIFSQFEEMFGLEIKVKFVLNHEIAHNIDCAKNYTRGEYSLKNIMENHLGTRLSAEAESPFKSTAELDKTKKMIKQIWTLSLEHYADTLGFLNLRNQFLGEGMSENQIEKMLDVLIEERKKGFKRDSETFIDKYTHEKYLLEFDDKYKCMNHFTVNALLELKNTLKQLGDKVLPLSEIEKITVDIVNQADLKALYVLYKLDKKSAELLDNVFASTPNEQCVLCTCESKKPEFEENIKNLLGTEWLKEVDKFIIANKEKMGIFSGMEILFTKNLEQLKDFNKQEISYKIQQVRESTQNNEAQQSKTIKHN